MVKKEKCKDDEAYIINMDKLSNLLSGKEKLTKDLTNLYWKIALVILLIGSCFFDIATTLRFSTHLPDLEANPIANLLPFPFWYSFMFVMILKIAFCIAFCMLVININKIQRKGFGMFWKYNMFCIMVMIIGMQFFAGFSNLYFTNDVQEKIEMQYNTSYETFNDVPVEYVQPYVVPEGQRMGMYAIIISLLGLFPYIFSLIVFLFYMKIVDF